MSRVTITVELDTDTLRALAQVEIAGDDFDRDAWIESAILTALPPNHIEAEFGSRGAPVMGDPIAGLQPEISSKLTRPDRASIAQNLGLVRASSLIERSGPIPKVAKKKPGRK